jgi:hypothetical protein
MAVLPLFLQTCSVLPNESIQGMMQLCFRFVVVVVVVVVFDIYVLSHFHFQYSNTSDTLASYFWSKGKYVLLLYPMTHDLQIVEQFQSVRAQMPQATPKVASSLAWIAVEDLYSAHSSIRIGNQDTKIYSLVKSMLTEARVLAEYLSGLQQRLQASTPPTSPPSLFGAGAGAAGGLFGGVGGLASVVATPTSLFGVPPAGGAATTAVGFGGVFGGAATASTSTNVLSNFQQIAEQFGQQFYAAFNGDKTGLPAFFNDQSMFTCMGEQIGGQAPILAKLQTMPVQLTPVIMSAQPIPSSNGVMLIVMGSISNSTSRFSQVFTLLPQGQSFAVHNMVLRDY